MSCVSVEMCVFHICGEVCILYLWKGVCFVSVYKSALVSIMCLQYVYTCANTHDLEKA